ncbi:unnamed protein product, partial [Discosporangium mesarthrocarpum]
LVHVSTAFVHGRHSGAPTAPLPEALPDLEGLDPERIYHSARETHPPGALSALAFLGHPNTYTFTKALTEHLLVRARPRPCLLRLCIMRPSIVSPSWVFPWPGWTGERPSTVTGCLVLILRRVTKTFLLGPHPAPIVPVDVVSRAIVHRALGWGCTAGMGAGAGAAGGAKVNV